MLLSRRVIQAPELGALNAEFSILHSKYRIFIEVFQKVVHDDALFLPAFTRRLDPRSSLVIPLEGRVVLRSGGSAHSLEAGSFMTELRSNGWHLRYEPTVTMVVEWVPGSLGTRPVPPAALGSIGARNLERLRALVARLLADGVGAERASRVVAEILTILRSEGLPFDPVDAGAIYEETPSWLPSLVATVDRAVSSLSDKPSLIDFERSLGWSVRQIQRRLQEVQQRYAYNAREGWREMHWRWRLVAGANLMSIEGATTEKVAAHLGYASPRAFCDAFAKAGLPSPGAIRERLRELL